jgi:uncharacterized protein YkwD
VRVREKTSSARFCKYACIARRLGTSIVVASLVLLVCTSAAGARDAAPTGRGALWAVCRGALLRPTRTDLAAVNAATVCLIDRVRRAAHLEPLQPNPSLDGVAAGQSSEMVHGDYFGDQSRSGRTPLQRLGATPYAESANAVSMAQNIGWATGTDATPTGIVAAWMHSLPHREIILTAAFRDIGVGAAPAAPAAFAAGQPGATYTADFGVRVLG